MTEGDKEIIKIRASFFNGIAIASMFVGGVVPALDLRAAGWFPGWRSLLVFFAGYSLSLIFHNRAKSVLRTLDRSS